MGALWFRRMIAADVMTHWPRLFFVFGTQPEMAPSAEMAILAKAAGRILTWSTLNKPQRPNSKVVLATRAPLLLVCSLNERPDRCQHHYKGEMREIKNGKERVISDVAVLLL